MRDISAPAAWLVRIEDFVLDARSLEDGLRLLYGIGQG